VFSADRVFAEDSGFQLWLGSLDDALDLDALRKGGVTGILNVALQDCERERDWRGSRTMGARPRSICHAESLMTDSFAVGEKGTQGRKTLTSDQIREEVQYDGNWYSEVLGFDVAYLAVQAQDESEYNMAQHFPEVVEFLARCRKEQRRVLVHCVMGVNRSSASVCAFLCSPEDRGGVGLGLEKAVALASSARGSILTNESFLTQLVAEFST